MENTKKRFANDQDIALLLVFVKNMKSLVTLMGEE